MENVLNKTRFIFSCVGEVSEIALEMVDGQQSINHGQEKVACQVIRGNITMKCDNLYITLRAYFSSVGFDGAESRTWAMAQSMLEWNPAIKGNTNMPVTRARIKGEITPNDYYSTKDKKAAFSLRYTIRSASTSNIDENTEDFFNVNLENAFVVKVAPETKGEEETGRALIDFLGVNYNGEVFPIHTVVNEDAAEAVLEGVDGIEAFEPGQTRSNLELELVNASAVEAPKPKKKVAYFGKKERHGDDPSENNSRNFSNELVLLGGDPMPVEEPEEKTYTDDNGDEVEIQTLWLDPTTIKEALKIRKQKIEELEANPPQPKNNANTAPVSHGSSAFQNSKARAQAKAQASKKKVADPIPEGDPYDIDNIDF